jgi:hypothetical protein
VSEFDHPICQQPHAPALSPLRRIRAREGDQLSLGSPVQDPPPGPAGLLWHKRYLQAFLAEAPTLSRHRGTGDLKSLGDALVGPLIRAIGVGLEQYTSVEQFAGMRPATAHERFELGALLIGEADDVLLVHRDPPR